MSDFKQYRRKQIAELRPYEQGENISDVSVAQVDADAGSPKAGDMIAKKPAADAVGKLREAIERPFDQPADFEVPAALQPITLSRTEATALLAAYDAVEAANIKLASVLSPGAAECLAFIKRAEKAEAQLAEALAALEPFAAEAEMWTDHLQDDTHIIIADVDTRLEFSAFRAAAAVLAKGRKG